MIRFSVHFEIIDSPVGADLRRVVDHQFVVRILPVMLIRLFGAPVNDAPVRRRLDMQLDRVRLMTADVHEDLSACVIPVAGVELRVRPGEIISENLIGRSNGPISLPLHAPGLIVSLVPRQSPAL